MVWSGDGSRVAHNFVDHTYVFVCEVAEKPKVTRYNCAAPALAAAWSPDDRYLAMTHWKGVVIRDVSSGQVVHERPVSYPYFAVWDASGKRVVVSTDRNVIVLNQSWNANHTFQGDFETFDAVWSSDTTLLGATDIGLVQIYLDGSDPAVVFDAPAGVGRITMHGGVIACAIDDSVTVTNSSFETSLRLEQHAAEVVDVTFSHDGALLASIDKRGGITCWETRSWHVVGRWDAGGGGGAIQFSPRDHTLACVHDQFITFYDLSQIATSAAERSVHYTTAKIALVGDSGVGKSGLAWRLTHNIFKETASTHGEQFWVADRLSTIREDGTRCEAILWDLAGQPDYRLIHALFIDDADLALIVFDPTNRQGPLKGVEFWLRALGSREQRCRTILVAGRSDRGSGAITQEEVEAFTRANNITGGYVSTSARGGEGVEELVQRIQSLVGWDQRPATVTTATFKEIKDHILALKESEHATSVIATLDELRETLRERSGKGYDARDVATATKHLANHGYVRDLRNSAGAQFILLTPDLLNNLAASMVLEARRNPKDLGALDERRLLSGGYDFPELTPLAPREREILLDAAATLFIAHNICFRETLGSDTFLIFPSLINQNRPPVDTGDIVDGTAYTANGATENVYAALVVLLGYTNTFTRTAQWRNHAQYEMGKGQLCGFRLTEEREGEIELVLYFGIETQQATQQLFQSLFEKFLRSRHVQVEVFRRVDCPTCGYTQPRSEVIKRQRHETRMMFCANCGTKILLGDSPGVSPAPEAVAREQGTASRRTQFETALTTLKSYVRDTRAGHPPPSCFISYAWGDAVQERWVEGSLATDLRNAGIGVILDRWHAVPASSLTKFIEQVGTTDFVAIVGTPRLRRKYDAQQGDPVVAAELKMIGNRLRKSTKSNTVVPLLLEGDQETSFPPFAEDSIAIDFRNEDLYFERLFDLLLTLYRIPFGEPAMRDLRDTIHDTIDRRRRR